MEISGIGVYLSLNKLPTRIIDNIIDDLRAAGIDELNFVDVFVTVGKSDGLKAYRASISVIIDGEWQKAEIDLVGLSAAEQTMLDTLIKFRAADVLQEL